MYARSDRFDQAVRYGSAAFGATPIARVDAYRGGGLVAGDIPIDASGSTITVDEDASSWRTAEIVALAFEDFLVPRTPADALSPYGTDLFVQSGYRFSDGIEELVPVGVFRLLTAVPTRLGTIVLRGYDYSTVVARARFERPQAFPRGYSRSRAISDIIQERTFYAGPPGHVVLTYSTVDDTTLPLTIFEEGERYGTPWKACMDMADAAGQQVYFGPEGPFPTAILRLVPSLEFISPVWTFEAGEGSTLIDLKVEQDTTIGYNVFVVTGESADLAAAGLPSVRASAEITDATSPIYPGTYGRVPTFLASSFIRTTAQAQQVANANLPRKAGGTQRLTITGFPNPCHDGGDVVYARDPMLGIDSDWIVSRFSFKLSLKDPVDYACRARTVT